MDTFNVNISNLFLSIIYILVSFFFSFFFFALSFFYNIHMCSLSYILYICVCACLQDLWIIIVKHKKIFYWFGLNYTLKANKSKMLSYLPSLSFITSNSLSKQYFSVFTVIFSTILVDCYLTCGPAGWGCKIFRLHLCRRVRSLQCGCE